MRHSKVAARYAKSLLNLANEQGILEQIKSDMDVIHELSLSSKDFVLLLKSPVIKTDKKQAILSKILKDSVSAVTQKFVQIICTKKREDILDLIARSFVLQYKKYKKIVTAKVYSATPLDAKTKKKITELLKHVDSSEIEFEEHVNPELIGGLVLRIEDQQIDASVKTKLAELKEELTENLYISNF